MMRIKVGTSSDAAKSYYTHGLARQDYYTEDQEIVGSWGGLAASLLGLDGTVDKVRFDRLCDNLHPATGEKLTARTRASRRVGFDVNFHPPKSVSVLHAWTDDPGVVEAVRRAAHETMVELEAEAHARDRKQGRNADRHTGNLVWSEHVHFTSRPVGGLPDPHLHLHYYVFNATYDDVEKQWKALQIGEIHRSAPYYQAAFHNRVAGYLQELGYAIERKGKSFEVVGIPATVIRKFSRRTARIEAKALELGITDQDAKAKLGALTREPKRKNLSRHELRRTWDTQLISDEERARVAMVDLSQRLMRDRRRAQLFEAPVRYTLPRKAELDAVTYAVLHSFERASAVDEVRLREMAMQYAVGSLDATLLRQAVRNHPDLLFKRVDGRWMVTTQTVLAEEQAMVEWVGFGRGIMRPLLPNHAVRDERLNDEQRAAVRHILESRDRVIGLKGKAGTGKSTAMREVMTALRADGQKVLVMAPGSETARDTMPRDGIEDACTVALLLASPKLQEANRGGVWWVDEAGLISSRTMVHLCHLAEELGARLILSGDTGQHGPVERGDALRILERYADLEMATLKTVLRQQGRYKEAVELLAQHRVLEGLQVLDADGRILEIQQGPERYAALARQYLDLQKTGDTALIISPTHSEIAKVTEAVRLELKTRGKLKRERPIETLRKVDFNEAERSDARLYRPGWVVELRKPMPGHRAGDRLTVTGVEGQGVLRVQQSDGAEVKFEAAKWAKRFEVYEAGLIGVAPGELIRITQNGPSADGRSRLHNGTIRTVSGFTESGDIRLANGMVIDKDYGHLTYGYGTTSPSAQSKSVDWVLLAESTESLAAASREQGYVSLTRGKKGAYTYTDSKEELFEALQVPGQRVAALDIVREQEKPPTLLKTSVLMVQLPPDYAATNAPQLEEVVREQVRKREPEQVRAMVMLP